MSRHGQPIRILVADDDADKVETVGDAVRLIQGKLA